MLRERMNTDDNMRAPALEKLDDITHTPLMKKLARLSTKSIYEPVVILHPVLPVTQDPVVQTHQLRAEMMRLFNRTHYPDRIRLAFEKLLHTGDDRRRSGAMSATSVRRDDQYFRDALRLGHWYLALCPWFFAFKSAIGNRHSAMRLPSPLPYAPFSSRAPAS